jgi:beta-lactamase class A
MIDTVHDMYVRRLLTSSEAVGRLGALNLPGKQSDALMANWNVERDSRTSRPSKAELFKMFKAKIIDEGMLRDELEGLGYVEKTINLYLQMIKSG